VKIFVTGATGFVGSHFVKKAIADGHEVMALRRKGRNPRIVLDRDPIWVEGNLASDLSSGLDGCDALVHFAATGVSPQKAAWEELFQCNVMDSLKCWLTAVNKASIPRLIICGSCHEYGRTADRFVEIPPYAPLDPVSAYASSKAAASMAASGLCQQTRCQLIILRPFNIFGAGQHESNLWPSLRRAALAGEDCQLTPGDQIRDFIGVEKVVEAFVNALVLPLAAGIPEIRNVGSGHPMKLKEFTQYWWDRWGARGKLLYGSIPYSPGELMRIVPLLDATETTVM